MKQKSSIQNKNSAANRFSEGHIDAQSLPSPTTQSSSSGLVPGSTKYSRLATNGSPSHGRVGGGVSGYVATSTQELIQQQIRQQEQLVLHQDSQLSQMSQSVGTLRNVSTAIGSELDEQSTKSGQRPKAVDGHRYFIQCNGSPPCYDICTLDVFVSPPSPLQSLFLAPSWSSSFPKKKI